MKTFADQIISFNKSLKTPEVPEPFSVMNPFKSAETRRLSEQFFRKYYDDDRKRVFMFGINPGRFGAGQTGVSFTDPVYLEEVCGIENDLPKKHELSALFIHEMIAAFGGAEKFFSKFFITSVSPLGYLKGDVNANYYDDKELAASVRDFIIKTTEKQMKIGACREYAICIGTGKNFDYLKKLNAERGWFEKLEKVSHPRFVMQYRRKRKEEFVDTYLQVMQESLEATGI